MPVLDLMSGFIVELRNAGLPVSLTENLDAMEAVKEIPIEDRDAFKYALAATLVKSQNHWRAFETIFEVYFSLRGPPRIRLTVTFDSPCRTSTMRVLLIPIFRRSPQAGEGCDIRKHRL